jgi:ribosome-associated translation inhibitor RaiA
MQVIVHSDHNITADASLTQRVEAEVSNSIGRFAERIVKVEAFLSDTNSSKHGARDKRCVLEAKIAGSRPVVATDEAPTVLQALEGAAGKLERALEHAFGKHDGHR